MSQVSLNKVGEYWWSAVLEGEEHIDIDKINKERSMATVDEEEHAVLDRLTFDYHQKLQGKPQSHELVRRAGAAGACWGHGGEGALLWDPCRRPWPGHLSPSRKGYWYTQAWDMACDPSSAGHRGGMCVSDDPLPHTPPRGPWAEL